MTKCLKCLFSCFHIKLKGPDAESSIPDGHRLGAGQLALPCNCNKDWYVLLDLFGRSIPASEIQRDARHMLLRPLKELPPETCGLANSCTGKVAAAPFLMQVP